MIIHTVKNGENLYNIARKYSVPPTKILGDNDLYGDRLTDGDELLILIPTKTETVKGKDTIYSIAEKYGVKKTALLCANPSLLGKDKLRPGQVITVKQDTPTLGQGSAICHINKGCRRDNLSLFLPFSTYISINAAVIDDFQIKMSFDPSWSKELCECERKVHLLGIKDTSNGKFLSSRDLYIDIIENMISITKKSSYNGVFVSAKDAASDYPDAFCEFLLEARKRFIGCDLLLFTDVFENTPKDASEISDGAVLNINSNSIKSSRNSLKNFSSDAESSKVFINMPSEVLMGDKSISIKEAKELCYRNGLKLTSDDETLISSFIYTRYKVGKGEKIELSFPNLRYIKEIFEKLSSLGFAGISFDADICPISTLAMFSASFARADYSLPYKI